MAGLCQDCTGCCQVFEVRAVSKPFGSPCQHLGAVLGGGHGCTIYADRPAECQRYVCLYLDSQRRPEVERLPEALRPDVCRVIFGWPWGIDRETLHVYPYPDSPDAWRKGAVAAHLKMVLSRGGKVVVYENARRVIAMKGDMAVVGTEAEFAELLNRPELQEDIPDAAQ